MEKKYDRKPSRRCTIREKSDEKQAGFRLPRSIRFTDSEWKCIEQAAKARGMNAAEPVRHATVSFATDRFTENSEAFPSDIAARIECIYRGVYLVSTLEPEISMPEPEIRKRCERPTLISA